jgi:hypothetical protein
MPIALAAALGVVSVVGCAGEEPAEPAAPAARAAPQAPPPGAPSTRPAAPQWQPSADPTVAKFMGLVAPKPATWIEDPPSGGLGRVANYTIPDPDGGEAAHINVFYFGPRQGGDVQSNVERWRSQFRPGPDGAPPEPIVERLEAGGMTVTLVELAGAWMAMGQSGYAEDQLFIAAIVEITEGRVFVRFAGRSATVEANRQAFMQMVEGLRRAEPST